jgi:hypothetical protein
MDYGYSNSGYGAGGTVLYILYMAVAVLILVSLWKLFVKAGKPGWAAIVPIYNIITELEIVGRPWYWLLLMLIPFVNIVLAIIVTFRMAKVFGKDTGYGFGLLFLPFVFYPLLAFGDAKYMGPNVE